jgi:hypothetical protein
VAATTAVVAGTATAVSGSVSRRQQQKAYEQQAAREASYAPAMPAAAESLGEPDYLAELERLSQLKAKGIISEEDFEAKKKQLLGI